ncbi:MAG: TonB-dependent receptor [Bacteroidota bacterium]
MFKTIARIIILSCISLPVFSQTGSITGVILDEESNESLIGVSVLVTGTTKGSVTDLDGNFKISNIQSGDISLQLSYIGYETKTIDATIPANGNVDIGRLKMKSESIGLEEIKVFANVVVDRKTPVAASAIKNVQISQELGGMALPELLNVTPGVYATKGSGTFGDARINIRGFDQTETLFMINGVPLNDMENGRLYWSNFAGLSEVTRNMQVQRGLGASKLGVNSVGGTINIITTPASSRKGGKAEMMFGSGTWDSRYRLTLNSGKLNNGWAFTFQGSRTTGEGYKKGGFVDAWSYYLAVSKDLNDDHSLMFTVFGAPVNRGRAWNTNTAEYELRNDYFFNSSVGYYQSGLLNGSQNKSSKPQATLVHNWDINEKMSLTSSAYLSMARVYGTSPGRAYGVSSAQPTNEGYQDWEYMAAQNKDNEQTINNPNGDPSAPSISGAQSQYIIEARYNNHNWYGVISNFNYQLSNNTSIVAGIDIRDYTAIHYGEVFDLLGGDFWLDTYGGTDRNILEPNKVARLGDKINYNYDGNVQWGSVFGQVEHTIDKFNLFASANYARVRMWRYGNYWNGQSFYMNNSYGSSDKRVFNNYNLKAGVNYVINGRHSVFVNGGTFTRAPFLSNSFVDSRYSNTFLNDLKSESVLATEVGYRYRSSRIRMNLNAYYTTWADKAFSFYVTDPASGDRTYFSITGQDALHMGLEFDIVYNITSSLEFRGMASLGEWKWTNNISATVTDDTGGAAGTINVYADGLPVGNAAQTTAYVGAHYKGLKNAYMGFRFNYFGRLYEQYDPSSITSETAAADVRQLPDYTLFDIYGGYYFNVGDLRARAGANVHNLFNQLYIRRADARYGGEDYGFMRNFNANLVVYF